MYDLIRFVCLGSVSNGMFLFANIANFNWIFHFSICLVFPLTPSPDKDDLTRLFLKYH